MGVTSTVGRSGPPRSASGYRGPSHGDRGQHGVGRHGHTRDGTGPGGRRADRPRPASAALEGWGLVRRMLDDMTTMVETTAETERELLEGLRVLGRATALCSELSLDIDPERPWFFDMNTEARLIGGPDPGGGYHVAMIDGRLPVPCDRAAQHGHLSRVPGARRDRA